MTVSELIDILQNQDQSARVAFSPGTDSYWVDDYYVEYAGADEVVVLT